MNTPLAVALLGAGYVVGRTRPLRTLKSWSWRRTIHYSPTRAEQVLFIVLHPVIFTRTAVRSRHAPDTLDVRAPAPVANLDWAKQVSEHEQDDHPTA